MATDREIIASATVDVLFVQDWHGEHGERDDMPEWGDRDAMAAYMTQWDNGDETDAAHTRPEPSYGSDDTLTVHRIGGIAYVLGTHRFGYASLSRAPLA